MQRTTSTMKAAKREKNLSYALYVYTKCPVYTLDYKY